METLDINLTRIKDPDVQNALFNVVDMVRNQDLLNGQFTFYEVNFPKEVVNFLFPHKLGFQPKDVWITSQLPQDTLGASHAEFNYALFDKTNLNITTTGPVIVRFFAGSFN